MRIFITRTGEFFPSDAYLASGIFFLTGSLGGRLTVPDSECPDILLPPVITDWCRLLTRTRFICQARPSPGEPGANMKT